MGLRCEQVVSVLPTPDMQDTGPTLKRYLEKLLVTPNGGKTLSKQVGGGVPMSLHALGLGPVGRSPVISEKIIRYGQRAWMTWRSKRQNRFASK